MSRGSFSHAVAAAATAWSCHSRSRGVYGGGVGYLSYNGNMDLAITIRTIEMRDNKVYIQVGAGIVYDSVPDNEYEETINKAKALFKAVNLAANGIHLSAD